MWHSVTDSVVPYVTDDEDFQKDEPLPSESDDSDSDSEEAVTYDNETGKRNAWCNPAPICADYPVLGYSVRICNAAGEHHPDFSRSASTQDGIPIEPETKRELEQEIRSHDRRPIPHPTLVEEREEYDDDDSSPAVVPDLPAQGYEVVEEPGDEEMGYVGGSGDEESQLNNGDDEDEDDSESGEEDNGEVSILRCLSLEL